MNSSKWGMQASTTLQTVDSMIWMEFDWEPVHDDLLDDTFKRGGYMHGQPVGACILYQDSWGWSFDPLFHCWTLQAPVANIQNSHSIWHPIVHPKGAAQPTVPILSFNPSPTLKTEANTATCAISCVVGAQMWCTLFIAAPASMNTSVQEWFLKEPMADSTCQMVHESHVHLEDSVLEIESTMHWYHSNLLCSPWPQLWPLPHPHQLLQDLQGICPLPTSQSVFCVLHSLKPLLFWILIYLFLWQWWHHPHRLCTHVVVDAAFQLYIAEAWASFQASREQR